MRLLPLVAVVALSSLLLSACASDPDPTPTPTPAALTTPPPVVTPTTTPGPTKPALDDLILSPEGLGPLVPGQAPPVVDPALDILVFDPDHCAGVEYAYSESAWVANYEPALSGDDSRPFSVMVVDGLITIIGAFDSSLSTAEGISIGSSREELLASYAGGFSQILHEPGYSTIYIIDGDAGFLQIEVGPPDGGEGYADTVFAISILPTGTQPFGYWATDRGFGTCVTS